MSAKNREELIAQAKADGKDVNQEIASIDIEAEERAQKEVDEPSQSVDEIVTLEFPEEEESKPTKIMQLSAGPRYVCDLFSVFIIQTDLTSIIDTPLQCQPTAMSTPGEVGRPASLDMVTVSCCLARRVFFPVDTNTHMTVTDVLETPSRIRRGKLAKEYRVFKASA